MVNAVREFESLPLRQLTDLGASNYRPKLWDGRVAPTENEHALDYPKTQS